MDRESGRGRRTRRWEEDDVDAEPAPRDNNI
jgi:hypothetical protein